MIQAGEKSLEECSKMPTPFDIISRISVSNTYENENYNITSAKCSRCGRYGMAISEPNRSPYICRECYSGISNNEIGQRFVDLGEMIDEKKFIPTWATWIYIDSHGKRIVDDSDVPF